MKARVIFNPASGQNRRRPWLISALRDFTRSHSPDSEVVVTEGPGHATELARSAALADYRVVVAVGGDGTVNEVAQGLLLTPTALGLVPCGSGNGLALHLGLPTATLPALELALNPASAVAAIDTGQVNDRPFFNAMGLGLDADVSARFNRLTRRGLLAYLKTSAAALRELTSHSCSVRVGATVETINALLICAANSDQYGNHALIAPGARVDDGQLDLIAVRPVGLVGATLLGLRLFHGSLHRSPHVRRWRGTEFAITRPADGLIHTDGESHRESALLTIRTLAASLRVVIPQPCRAVSPARVSPPPTILPISP